MRYGIAVVVAVLLIGAGAWYVRQTYQSIEQIARQALRDAKAAGELPPGFDPEQANIADFGIELPASEMRRVKLANFLIAWRFVLIPMVVLGSLGIARITRKKRP
jgi:hypothetical protein